MIVKPVRSTAAVAKQIIVPVDIQPHWGPSIIPNTRLVTPAVETSTPLVSNLPVATFGSFGISLCPPTRVTTTIGTFTRKIDPYQKCWSNAPPVTGPNATAMPDVAPQMPSAF